MTERIDQKLWVPGDLIEYPAYTEAHLVEDWHNLYADPDVRATTLPNGLLGVVHVPEKIPERVASIDLCEVLRHTHLASARAVGKDRMHISNRVWFYSTLGLPPEVSPEIVKAVMNADLVEPVEEIAEIRDIMKEWKREGVYTVANTSTLPNCERATISNLLARELPGCFDGIVFPRNYDGNGIYTKGDALKTVVETVVGRNGSSRVEKALHIDDAPHHLEAVGAVMGEVAVSSAVIMPVYECGELAEVEEHEFTDSAVITASSSLGAFEKASEFLFR